MAKKENAKYQRDKENKKNDTLWRKPITLDSVDDEDPLEMLYKGREVGDKDTKAGDLPKKQKVITAKSADKIVKGQKKTVNSAKPKKSAPQKKTEKSRVANINKTVKKSRVSSSSKITVEELKNLLRIKSDSFQFTDIREILRGKSLDIYAYLRYLSGDSGVCKIRHNDLMNILDISRPTLFKQGSWLERLSLIKKHRVPGDHFGTSYTVNRLEDVLPASKPLVKQIDSYIESFK